MFLLWGGGAIEHPVSEYKHWLLTAIVVVRLEQVQRTDGQTLCVYNIDVDHTGPPKSR